MMKNRIDDQRFEEIEKSLIDAISSFNSVDLIPTWFSRDIKIGFNVI